MDNQNKTLQLIYKKNTNVPDEEYSELLKKDVKYMKDDFTVNKLMRAFCFLCKQIEILIDCKLIHHDLHFGNIMHDNEHNKLIIIDFGLSIIADNLYINDSSVQLNMPYLKKVILENFEFNV